MNDTGDEEQWIGNPPAYPTDNVEVHSVYRLNIDGFCVNLIPHPTSMVPVPKYGKGLDIYNIIYLGVEFHYYDCYGP